MRITDVQYMKMKHRPYPCLEWNASLFSKNNTLRHLRSISNTLLADGKGHLMGRSLRASLECPLSTCYIVQHIWHLNIIVSKTPIKVVPVAE